MIFLVGRTNFLVCRKKNFECGEQTFAASLPPFGESFATLWQEFCHLVAQVLLPYGKSFAVFWPPVLIIRAQFKSLLHLLGVGGVCVCRSLS